MRKQYSPQFKFKAVIAVLKEKKTAAEVAGELSVHSVILSKWKNNLLRWDLKFLQSPENLRMLLNEKEKAKLFEQIGRLKMEIEWLKQSWKLLPEGQEGSHRSRKSRFICKRSM